MKCKNCGTNNYGHDEYCDDACMLLHQETITVPDTYDNGVPRTTAVSLTDLAYGYTD